MQRFRICQISSPMKETRISGTIIFSHACCTEHTSRRERYIVEAIGVWIRVSRPWRNTSCATSIATSVHYSWLLPLLHQPQSGPTQGLETAASRSESTIGTTVITITGTTTKTAPTGVTWSHSTGAIVRTIGSTIDCRGTTGIGATVIRTAISEGRHKTEC